MEEEKIFISKGVRRKAAIALGLWAATAYFGIEADRLSDEFELSQTCLIEESSGVVSECSSLATNSSEIQVLSDEANSENNKAGMLFIGAMIGTVLTFREIELENYGSYI